MSDPVAGPLVAHDRDTVLSLIYADQYESLVRLARLLVDDRGSAEEVVQEAFARTYDGWRRVNDTANPLPYVRRTVVNLARGRLRRRITRRLFRSEPLPDAPSADVAVLAHERSRSLARAVRMLPRRQREVVVLRYLDDCSTAEVAATLVISEGSVKTHLHRALAVLATTLEDLR